MLSASEAARELGVSPARVRKLIADGALPARKIGRAWVLREEDVMNRLAAHVRPGRPKRADVSAEPPRSTSTPTEKTGRDPARSRASDARAHELYRACKEAFSTIPDPELMSAATSPEEASFYMAVADFFLQQKQRNLVAQGVY